MASSPHGNKINFFFEDVSLDLRHRKSLRKFIERLFRDEGKSVVGLNYIFSTDATLLKINRKYLQHDYYTDILTFDLTERPGQIMADIYISIDRIRENCREQARPFKEELHRVIFHGALHLCGYNDRTPTERLRMRQLEEHYLTIYHTRFT